ncbi:MAG: penicillin-binding protein 1A [Hydrogenophilaceae bacterium]|nr:penicillin-binding protein 1A [Hydrogenophilaceae bacterium]
MFSKWWHYALALFLGLGIVGTALGGLAAALIYPNLPSIESLRDYKPKIPLRIYSAEGALLAEIGEERRAFMPIDQIPQVMKQAIIAAEDERFYEHGGVDTLGVLRAAGANILSGGASQGASTITMQVARNFFLTRERTLTRKISEALLAIKIEHNLSKDKILELYINQIYLGQRAYGFEAAARTYFGKGLKDLSVAETAMLAGLPKGPSLYNPVVNPQRATARQHYVLGRMKTLKFINEHTYQTALKEKLIVRREKRVVDVPADYATEMVRQTLVQQFGEEALYNTGFKVITTLRRSHQEAANQAIWRGVLDYDQRHGYRGPERFFELPKDSSEQIRFIQESLKSIDPVNALVPAVVVNTSAKSVKAILANGKEIQITTDGLKLANSWLGDKAARGKRITPGSLIRVQQLKDKNWKISQLPEVEAALVAMDPSSGAITALVGGFDFNRNKFNHASQAWRQPGSSFKPFIYSAALEKGYTPATIIEDAPLSLSAEETGSTAWEPQNYDGSYSGPVRMRTALTKSLNLVSIRILQGIGPYYARDYIRRFGFDPSRHPPYLTMALGAGSVTPLQMAGAYSVFANSGYRVSPYLIDKVYDGQGKLVMQSQPQTVASGAPRVLDPRNAFLMTSMMQDVVRKGTAARASQLGRIDLAGKTGTTNDQRDGWFAGYSPNLTAVTWIGFDLPKSLGERETAAQSALPIWMDFMGRALSGTAQKGFGMPAGVSAVKINPVTGQAVPEEGEGVIEYFYQENMPASEDNATPILEETPLEGMTI